MDEFRLTEGMVIKAYHELTHFAGMLGFRVVTSDEEVGGIVICIPNEQNTVVYDGSTIAEGMSWCMGYSKALKMIDAGEVKGYERRV